MHRSSIERVVQAMHSVARAYAAALHRLDSRLIGESIGDA